MADETQHDDLVTDEQITSESVLVYSTSTPDGQLPSGYVARPVGHMITVQVVLYVLFIAFGFLATRGIAAMVDSFSLASLLSLIIIVAFVFFTPLRDRTVGRVFSLIFGLFSVLFANTYIFGNAIFPNTPGLSATHASNSMFVLPESWIAAAGTMLVLLTIIAFACQMAREERSNMIVQMAHMILDGAACIAAAGWSFIPCLFDPNAFGQLDGSNNVHTVWLISVIVLIVLAVLMVIASVAWLKELDPLDDARSPWIGVGLLPVMLMGALVGIAALAIAVW